MSFNKDEAIKMAYDASITTLGAVVIGVASKKRFKANLGVPMDGYGIIKMAVALAEGPRS